MQGQQPMKTAQKLGKWMHRAAIMASIAVGLTATNAAAAIIPLGIEELVAHSDEVVSGHVAEQQEVVFTAGKIYTVSEFIVDESFKGERASGEAIQIAVPGGEIGGIGQRVTNVAQLRPNERLVLFLDNPTDEQRATASQATQIRADHPILTTPRVVGGPQGKFAVVTREETESTAGLTSVRTVTRVMREVPGRAPKATDFPAIEDFGAAIRRIADKEVPVRRSVRTMPGVEPVDIAVRDPDASALRVFDPIHMAAPSVRKPSADKPLEPVMRTTDTPTQQEPEQQ